MRARGLAMIAAILLAGCATSAPPSSHVPSSSAEYQRCSPADPDRFAWFCVLGQVLYSTLSNLQPDAALGPR